MLVHDAVAGDERLVVDHHVPTEDRAGRHDHPATEPAIVPDVHLRHEVVVVADLRPRLGLRAAVHLGMLTKDVAVADPEAGRRTGVGEVLRLVADHRPGMNDVVGAELRASREIRAGKYAGACSDADRAVDHDVRTDVRRRMDLGRAVNHRRRMDRHALAPGVLRRVVAGLRGL